MSSLKRMLIFVSCILAFPILGQEKITLDQCLAMADSNQRNFILEKYAQEQTNLDLKFHKYSLLPSISAFTSFDASVGRRLDPITNTFANKKSNSQSYGLSSSLPIFNGFSYWSEKNKLNIQNQMNELEVAKKSNRIHLSITELYVELCVLQLNMDLGSQRLIKLNEIKKVQKDLIQAGRINYIDTLRTANAIMSEEFLQKDAVSSFKSKTIDLNYLLGVDLEQSYLFDKESIVKSKLLIFTEEELSLTQMELEVQQLTIEQKQRKSALLPSLSLRGSFVTGYSSNNIDYSLPEQPVIDYNTQISGNVYGNVGVQLNIPLFGRGEYIKSVKLMEIRSEQYAENAKNMDQLINMKTTQYLLSRERLMELCQNKQVIEDNCKTIYDASFEEYKGGRITYNDFQDAFIDWQSAIFESESSKLELLKLDLLNRTGN